MANFVIANSTNGTQQAVASSSYISLCTAYCSTTGTAGLTRRGKLYDILVGTNGTPADNYMEWAVFRITGPSTSTLVTPIALDLADTAWASGATVNSTTMPTLASTAMVWYVGINQRASYRWVAAPGSEMVWPATSSAGLTLCTKSAAYTGTATGTIYVQEQ